MVCGVCGEVYVQWHQVGGELWGCGQGVCISDLGGLFKSFWCLLEYITGNLGESQGITSTYSSFTLELRGPNSTPFIQVSPSLIPAIPRHSQSSCVIDHHSPSFFPAICDDYSNKFCANYSFLHNVIGNGVVVPWSIYLGICKEHK